MTAPAEELRAPRLPVTVVIPVRNEARALPACLEGLGAFEHVLVVDSRSTDGTRLVAEAAGAEVIDFDWPGGFPKKRNWVLLNYAFRTAWVLFLDADEIVSPAFVAEVGRRVAADQGKVGYWLTYDNVFMGGRLRYGVPQRKLALFKVGAGLYERIDDGRWSSLDMEVHEHPVLDGPVGEVREPIEHNDDRGLHAFIDKHNQYSSWEAQRYHQVVAGLTDTRHLTKRQLLKYRNLRNRAFPFAYFALNYFAYGAMFDGWRGFVYSAFKAFYFMQVREKIVEIERQAGAAPAPASVAERRT